MSLAAYSNQSGLTMCRPVLLPNRNDNVIFLEQHLSGSLEFIGIVFLQAFLEIRNGCHPCVGQNISGTDFIPNDTVVGVSQDVKTNFPMRISIC